MTPNCARRCEAGYCHRRRLLHRHQETHRDILAQAIGTFTHPFTTSAAPLELILMRFSVAANRKQLRAAPRALCGFQMCLFHRAIVQNIALPASRQHAPHAAGPRGYNDL